MNKKDCSTQLFLRNCIGEYMEHLGSFNEKVVLVNADLMGTCRNKSFVEKFPERAFNVGIAEQNMISFAAGLAKEGFIPFVFTMAPFMSMRACEQCRTDVAYANLPVKMIATYAGVSGGISGATHWAVEDCGIMTSIPNMTVLEPCDCIQAISMLNVICDNNKPIYVRSSVEPVSHIYDDSYSFEIGKGYNLIDGVDGYFICSGIEVKFAIQAAKLIKTKFGKVIGVIDMPTIKPVDREIINKAALTNNIIVAQDHNIIGGLGTAVATVLTEEKKCVNFKILGIPDVFVPMAHAPFLYQKFELDSDGLEKNMLKLLQLGD